MWFPNINVINNLREIWSMIVGSNGFRMVRSSCSSSRTLDILRVAFDFADQVFNFRSKLLKNPVMYKVILIIGLVINIITIYYGGVI
ncbi:unnamed protein product [Schistosoma guineensis]|nr:unnamed protein product [Schistosoma guineensis]